MTKREMIDRILRLNRTAKPGFLAEFDEQELLSYLHQLQELEIERFERRQLKITAPAG